MIPSLRCVRTRIVLAVLPLLSMGVAKPAPPVPSGAVTADPIHAFAAYKVYDANGSPLRMPIDDWEGARKRMKSDPAWAAWIASRRSSVDTWMATQHDHVNWTAGWFHDFVSPKDGSHLDWTPEEPGENTLHSASDPQVKLTPKLRAAWVYEFRNRHSNEMVEAAELYRLTGERKYADWAASQLDFYADNFATWPTGGPLAQPVKAGAVRGSRLFWQSLDEAVALTKYVQTARYLGDYVTPERKQRWTTALFLPDCDILNKTMRSIHNIACWHRAAAGFVAVYTGDAATWKIAVEDQYGIRDQLNRGVTADGLWREQSMGYNKYVCQALVPFFEFASENGYAPKLTTEMAKAENLLLAPMDIRFPTGQLPNPADAGAPGEVPDVAALADFARIYPTKLGLAASGTRRDWESLLDPLPASAQSVAAVEAGLPPVRSWNLEASRMAVLKKGAWQVYVHYGQLTSSHAEAEALNYEAFYERTDVTHDAGTVGYGSPLHQNFYRTGLAHNVPLVDGVGQNGWNVGKLLAFDGDAGSISVSQPTYWVKGSAQRDMAIESGDKLSDTVTVATTDGMPHEIGLLIQTQGTATLPASFQPDPDFTRPGPTRPAGFRYWTEVRSAAYNDTAEFDLTYADGTVLHLQLQTPGAFTVTHASVPDVPPHRREVFFFRPTAGVTGAVFKTVLGPK